ncbi:MAG: InlB B-repeat-containing protein [Eggerthellaceae bacterium]|nr:InlB B-repeat-containing protein [Eggerthellaceae bacterium]
MGWSTRSAASWSDSDVKRTVTCSAPSRYYAIWKKSLTLSFDPCGGSFSDGTDAVKSVTGSTFIPNQLSTIFFPDSPTKKGFAFKGWFTASSGGNPVSSDTVLPISNATYYAQWERTDYDLGFDVDSEPGDGDYPGIDKPDQTVNVESGPTVIEDPKRPGYVFQGWTVPNAEGTEAIDQDLVYQDETDGKWYVDASKLPDYAGDDGRVELTARWTSVINVDVPSSVTFYADVVTQGNESREGLASSAFGQSKMQSQSEVDLRIVGLESKQVKGNGSTSLGASDILKKKDGSDLPATSDKLFSLYPTTGNLTEDDLKDPDATSVSKPVGAVDFSLDDILLEKSFAADKFTIPAGDTLSLGYRLNLSETDTVLDYDKLSALPDDSTASIATISYCFAADGLTPSDWQEPLWVEDPDGAGFLLLDDIKEAALDLSAHAPDVAASSYYTAYKKLFDADASFHLLVGDAYYDVRILGIGQDTMSDGGKAGLTFEMKGAYDEQVVPSSGAWGYNGSALQKYLEEDFYGRLGARMRDEKSGIVGVTKRHQVNNTMTLQTAVYQHVFVPSFYEIFGVTRTSGGWNNAESASNSFQYQHFAKGGANVSASPYRVKKDSTGAARIWVGRSAQYDGNLRTHISGAYMDGSMSRVSSGSPSWFAPCFCL